MRKIGFDYKRLYYIAAAALLVVLDFFSKVYISANFKGAEKVLIPGVLGITYAENTGVAFSFLQGKAAFFVTVTIIEILAILWFVLFGKMKSKLFLSSLCLILAGGVGNLIDRISKGYVVDFIEFLFVKFAVFNLADVFINIGVGLLLIFVIFIYKQNDAKKSS